MDFRQGGQAFDVIQYLQIIESQIPVNNRYSGHINLSKIGAIIECHSSALQ